MQGSKFSEYRARLRWRPVPAFLFILAFSGQAIAQRASENAVTAAADAFGTSIGDISVGLYDPEDVRGFSPIEAGNLRLEGLYFVPSPARNGRILAGSDIHVGISSLGYPFPAPTGIADFRLRPAGNEPILASVAMLSSLGSYQLTLDGQLPLGPTLSLAGGIAYRRTVDQPGGDLGKGVTIGIVPAWRPAEGVEIRPFWSRAWFIDDITTPYIFVDGIYAPPRFKRQSYAQRWTGWNGTNDEFGILGTAPLGAWKLRAGAFGTTSRVRTSYNDLYLETSASGLAQHHIINIEAPRGAKSRSGEIRLSRQFAGKKFLHDIHFSMRGFSQNRRYGGGDSVDFGPAQVGVFAAVPEPNVVFGAQAHEKVRQWTGGIGYVGRWAGVGELSLGIQRTDYRRQSDAPLRPSLITTARPWLWNIAAAAYLTSRLAFYGGYTRGLEGSSDAPEIATNRNEAPPAILTSQREAGFRYAITPKLNLMWGWFDVRKPYFNLDRDLHYGQLGTIRHRGMEISLTGEAAEGLNVVAGAVLMRPRITGQAVDDGLIGPKPVGQAPRIAKADLDYRPGGTSPFSVDLSFVYIDKMPASLDNQLVLPSLWYMDAGARYRFNMAAKPATLRLLAENLTNMHGWSVTASGGFRPRPQRRLSLTLAVDL